MSNDPSSQINLVNGFLDKCVNAVSAELTPGIWVLVLIALVVYAIKELMAYNKTNTANKSEVHDRLDTHTFKDTVVPLLSELNNQLQGDTVTRLELSGEESPEEIIELYEKEKLESVNLTDLSTLETSINLTDTLDKMAAAKKSRTLYDKCYKNARRCLQIGVVTLGLNLVMGIGLMLAVVLQSPKALSRTLLLFWVTLLLTNAVIAVIYIVNKTRMDGYIDED